MSVYDTLPERDSGQSCDEPQLSWLLYVILKRVQDVIRYLAIIAKHRQRWRSQPTSSRTTYPLPPRPPDRRARCRSRHSRRTRHWLCQGYRCASRSARDMPTCAPTYAPVQIAPRESAAAGNGKPNEATAVPAIVMNVRLL